MAIEKVINITVNTNVANANVEKLNSSIKNIGDTVEKLNSSIKNIGDVGEKLNSSIKNIGDNVEKLNSSIKNIGDVGKSSSDKYSGSIKKSNILVEELNKRTGGLVNTFLDVSDAAKKAGIGMKTALLATGIGAIVIAVGVLVAYWDEIVDFISGANAKLQQQIDLNNEILNDLNYELKLLSAKEKVLIAEGKSTDEIKVQKEKILLIQAEQNKLLIENLRIQLEKEKAQVREISFWEKVEIATLKAVGAYDKAGIALAESIAGDKEERDALDAIEKQIQDALLRSEDLKLALIEINKTEVDAGGKITKTDTSRDDKNNLPNDEERLKALSDFERNLRKQDEDYYAQTELEKIELQREREQEQLDALVASETEKREAQRILNEYYDQLELDAENKLYAEKEALRKKDLADEKKRLEDEEKAKRALEISKLNMTKGTLGNISQALGEGSEEGKAFAAASALINTYQGISAELATKTATPFEFGLKIANIAATTAIGFKSVKDILSTNPKGVASASGGGGSLAGVTAPTAPSFNLVSGTGANQIAESIAGDRQPIKAYVVSGEMSTQQALDRNIENTATI